MRNSISLETPENTLVSRLGWLLFALEDFAMAKLTTRAALMPVPGPIPAETALYSLLDLIARQVVQTEREPTQNEGQQSNQIPQLRPKAVRLPRGCRPTANGK